MQTYFYHKEITDREKALGSKDLPIEDSDYDCVYDSDNDCVSSAWSEWGSSLEVDDIEVVFHPLTFLWNQISLNLDQAGSPNWRGFI